MKFEVGKKYKRPSNWYSGDEVFECIFVSPRGWGVLKALSDGSEGLFQPDNEWLSYVEPRSGTKFVNVYDNNGDIWMSSCKDKKEADKIAQKMVVPKRIACVEVHWVEGQGL